MFLFVFGIRMMCALAGYFVGKVLCFHSTEFTKFEISFDSNGVFDMVQSFRGAYMCLTARSPWFDLCHCLHFVIRFGFLLVSDIRVNKWTWQWHTLFSISMRDWALSVTLCLDENTNLNHLHSQVWIALSSTFKFSIIYIIVWHTE